MWYNGSNLATAFCRGGGILYMNTRTKITNQDTILIVFLLERELRDFARSSSTEYRVMLRHTLRKFNNLDKSLIEIDHHGNVTNSLIRRAEKSTVRGEKKDIPRGVSQALRESGAVLSADFGRASGRDKANQRFSAVST
jgi:hypothetical protein